MRRRRARARRRRLAGASAGVVGAQRLERQLLNAQVSIVVERLAFGGAKLLAELPAEVRDGLRWHPVRTMDEVLDLALRSGAPGEGGDVTPVGGDVPRARPEARHRREGGGDDTLAQPLAAGVHRRDDAALGVGEQDRHAVGDQHAQHEPGGGRHDTVGGRQRTLDRAVDDRDAPAVHLVHPDQPVAADTELIISPFCPTFYSLFSFLPIALVSTLIYVELILLPLRNGPRGNPSITVCISSRACLG